MKKQDSIFPSKEIKRLHSFYLDKDIKLIEIKDLNSSYDLFPFISYGMPILYKSGFKYPDIKTAVNKIMNAVGENTIVNIRYGNFHIPYEYAFDRKEKKMSFKDFLHNHFLNATSIKHYLGNLSLNNDLLELINLRAPDTHPQKNMGTAKLWIGEKGCITPLHCDGSDNFVYQLLGTKKWKLIPPLYYDNVYINPEAGIPEGDFWCSQVDLGNINHVDFPNFSKVKIIEVVVHEGEALYIPYGWFHYVETLDHSITANFWINNRGLTPAVFNKSLRSYLHRTKWNFKYNYNLIKERFKK